MYRKSGGARVFADTVGRLWSAAHTGEAVVFTCISDGRQSGRALAVNVADPVRRGWRRDTPRRGWTPRTHRGACCSYGGPPDRGRRTEQWWGGSDEHEGVSRAADIRNIAVVGHGASGKTSLVDALAFVSGSSKRHGSIKEGTTLTDYSPEETDRGFSINLGCAFAEWSGTKINLIDTPGYLDFHGDAVAGVAAADGALCVVPATAGVEVGTELRFREAVNRRDPVLFVVSMMDKEFADFDRIYQQIKTRLTSKVIPIEVPIGQGADFHGIVNLFFTRKAHLSSAASKRASTRRRTSRPRSSRCSIATTTS